MSKVSSNHPRDSGNTATSSSRPNKVLRPSLPEVMVGLIAFTRVGVGIGSQLRRFGLDSVVYGLVFTPAPSWFGSRSCGQHLDLRDRSRLQYRLSCGCGSRSRHCRNLSPQRIGLDCYYRSHRFQPAYNSGDDNCWHELIGWIIWRLNQWQF